MAHSKCDCHSTHRSLASPSLTVSLSSCQGLPRHASSARNSFNIRHHSLGGLDSFEPYGGYHSVIPHLPQSRSHYITYEPRHLASTYNPRQLSSTYEPRRLPSALGSRNLSALHEERLSSPSRHDSNSPSRYEPYHMRRTDSYYSSINHAVDDPLSRSMAHAPIFDTEDSLLMKSTVRVAYNSIAILLKT